MHLDVFFCFETAIVIKAMLIGSSTNEFLMLFIVLEARPSCKNEIIVFPRENGLQGQKKTQLLHLAELE